MVKPSCRTDSLCMYQKGYQQPLENLARALRCCVCAAGCVSSKAQSGRFYSFAPHHGAWTWCYLIWLDKLSPSSPCTVADTAWENDLEPLEEAA
jgi:hypothetical protein